MKICTGVAVKFVRSLNLKIWHDYAQIRNLQTLNFSHVARKLVNRRTYLTIAGVHVHDTFPSTKADGVLANELLKVLFVADCDELYLLLVILCKNPINNLTNTLFAEILSLLIQPAESDDVGLRYSMPIAKLSLLQLCHLPLLLSAVLPGITQNNINTLAENQETVSNSQLYEKTEAFLRILCEVCVYDNLCCDRARD